ncbi:hypothetical protein CONLIGDRAFT_569509 [Coniochaeta ligniaria NRRL 30616]|uniref:Zn(2)-C6 fungal-type domain-containing protein n=1 Tax=Coniochaeta ligniaria NRRL 30616 TaxID=1408157 RepID=A0A1J7JWE4_9PEZI|nr:hypothetical protein CONLIGDRAFT_569509 [Coniochaeta ligniaria NRRL 30616]
MVYCGKPSKGCSNCRERKIRCDQREPGCGQCEKRQQECPGYRNIVDLMFRDESSHVIKKAKAKARKKAFLTVDPGSPSETEGSRLSVTPEPKGKSLSLITPSSRSPKSPAGPHLNWTKDDSSLLPSPDSGSWPSTPMIAMLYNLNPTSQERGTAYFFSRYVAVDENSSHQRFDFVYDVWKPVSLVPERQVDGVLASMSAVGLVGLANMTRSPEAADAARKAYGTALRLTNQALRDPAEAVKDTTMLAILILSLFEMMTETTPKTLQAWQEHVNGATALAKMRGVEQFKTPGGTKMFLMLCQKVMISCIQREIPMPQTLIDLRHELAKVLDSDDPTWQIPEPIYKVLQARYDIKTGILTDPDDIVTRLLTIEDEFESILSRFPKEWNYRTVQVTKRHPAIYRGLCHVYPSLFLASLWNGVRTCRILVLETVLSQLHAAFQCTTAASTLATTRYAKVYQTSRRKLEQMVEAIIASVPQHIGLVTPRTHDNLTTPISSVTVRETPSPATSPPSVSSRASVSSGGAANSPEDSGSGRKKGARSGPTLLDPLRTSDPDEEARKFMLLASSTNIVIWPLYVVGVSSVCTEDMKVYVVERLQAICAETGDRQADAVASMVEEQETLGGWLDIPLRPRGQEGAATRDMEWIDDSPVLKRQGGETGAVCT